MQLYSNSRSANLVRESSASCTVTFFEMTSPNSPHLETTSKRHQQPNQPTHATLTYSTASPPVPEPPPPPSPSTTLLRKTRRPQPARCPLPHLSHLRPPYASPLQSRSISQLTSTPTSPPLPPILHHSPNPRAPHTHNILPPPARTYSHHPLVRARGHLPLHAVDAAVCERGEMGQ